MRLGSLSLTGRRALGTGLAKLARALYLQSCLSICKILHVKPAKSAGFGGLVGYSMGDEEKPVKCRLMNCRAVGNQAYVPTEVEHIANVVTHGLCILPSLLGLVFLLQLASNPLQYVNALVYGFALVALFSVSTIFHSIFYLGRFRLLKEILHRCDRAVIYFFIAASYSPWLNLRDMTPGSFSLHVRWLVWCMALLGIVYQQIYHERYKWLETLFYFIMGFFPCIAIVQMEEYSGMRELAFGGVMYVVGVVFFKSDGRIPCAHAIWHLFVGLGAMLHYYAICKYLMGKHNEVKMI